LIASRSQIGELNFPDHAHVAVYLALDLILLARWRRSSCRVLIGILALPLMVPLALVLASISIVTGFPLCS